MTAILLIDKDTNKVVNKIVPPSGSNVYFAPEEYHAVESDTGNIGEIYDFETQTFSPDPSDLARDEEVIAQVQIDGQKLAALQERRMKIQTAISALNSKENLTIEDEGALASFENALDNIENKIIEAGGMI